MAISQSPMYGSIKQDGNVPKVLYKQAFGSGGVEHENTTDAADLFSYSIPANTLEVGDIVRVKIYATVIDSNGSDTLTPILNIAGSACATGAALDVADNDVVWAEAEIFVTKIGSAGAMNAFGKMTTNTGDTQVCLGSALSSKDTTAAIAIALNVDWDAAHADNEVRLDAAIVEVL